MPRVLIVGGKLQGTEVAYLASCAGYETVLVDRCPRVPAAGLVDEVKVADARDAAVMLSLMQDVDAVLPAVEDAEVLDVLAQMGRSCGVPVAYDSAAYRVSSSKSVSNRLFSQWGVPAPAAWPACGFPVVVKPDGASGSQGVSRVDDEEGLARAVEKAGDAPVVQQFVEGRSYSMEVIGDGSRFGLGPITEVCMDGDYDCCRIEAPADIDEATAAEFTRIGELLGRELGCRGIFDIEVMVGDGAVAVLEIDARFPSQTPVSIFHATGVNLVQELLCALGVEGVAGRRGESKSSLLMHGSRPKRVCFYQQVVIRNGRACLVGEHIIARCGPLHRYEGFLGADVVLADSDPDKACEGWCAIVIVVALSHQTAREHFDTWASELEEHVARTARSCA